LTDLPSRVLELAEQVAAGNSVEVLEARLTGAGRGRKLSVILDADDPVEADVVEQVAKQLSRALDAEDPIPGRYTLEVTTPGLDRPLRTRRDFRRQLGHEVRVTLADGQGPELAGQAPGALQGVVRSVDDRTLTLEVAGDQVRVPLGAVVKGKVVLPW
jgi:ribosome maturation factor RimP